MSTMKADTTINNLTRKRQAWYAATKLQSDLLVEVDDVNLHLHKFPLLSRSGLLNKLVFESRDTENGHIKLVDFPGGTETFELAAKFCYGSVPLEITASNVSALRCAAEYLEMTEDLEEGNLISKTEAFLSYILMSSWLDCMTVLQSCSGLSPWAKNLNIEQRCVDSIAWKAVADTSRIRWAFTDTKKTHDLMCPLKMHCIIPNNMGNNCGIEGKSSAHEEIWPTQTADIGLEIQKLRADFTTLEKLCQSIVEHLQNISIRKMSILPTLRRKYFTWKSRNRQQKALPLSLSVLNELPVETDENHVMPSIQEATSNNFRMGKTLRPRRNSI